MSTSRTSTPRMTTPVRSDSTNLAPRRLTATNSASPRSSDRVNLAMVFSSGTRLSVARRERSGARRHRGGGSRDGTGLYRPGMPAVTLRPASPGDVEPIARIWATGWRDGHLGHVPESLVAARTPDSFAPRVPDRIDDVTVAVIDGVVVGFVMVTGDEVEQVYVDRAARGGGAAAALLADAVRQVGAAGHATAWLAVVPGNARARRFYEREGWADDGPLDYEVTVAGATLVVPCRRMTIATTPATPPS